MSNTAIINLSANTISIPNDIGGGSLASNATTIVAFDFITVATSLTNAGLIDDVALKTIPTVVGGVVDFTTVAAALGSGAGAHANYTFKSDGAGSGDMAANAQVIPNFITVGVGGDVDYNSIKEAVNAAISRGVSLENPYIVEVYGGIYNEDSFTIVPGLTVSSPGAQAGTFIIQANNPNADLITMTGGFLFGAELNGVLDPLRSLIRCSTTDTACTISGCTIGHCSNGIIIENGAIFFGSLLTVLIIEAGLDIGTVISIDGYSTDVTLSVIEVTMPHSVLSLYNKNPIQTVISVSNNASATITDAHIDIPFFDSTQIGVLADTGANVVLQAAHIDDSYTAVKINAGGNNTTVIIEGAHFVNNTINFSIASSTGVILTSGITLDVENNSLVPGAILTGIQHQLTNKDTQLIGNVQYQYIENDKNTSFSSLIIDQQPSGVSSGGIVTSGVGLSVDVSSGAGWINTNNDVENVSWNATTLSSLPASSTVFIYIDNSTLLPTFSLSVPGTNKIPLAIVITSGSGIRYIHNDHLLSGQIENKLQHYLLETRKFLLREGLGVSAGSTSTRINIDAGTYYRGLEINSYAGSSDTTFSYFYGTNGATEVLSQQNFDVSKYDNAGTLTTMTDGYYRADTVYITSDGKVSVIYGTTQYSNLGDAQAAAVGLVPSFIAESAFSVANVIIQKTTGIVFIKDERTVSTTGNGSLAITDHSQLTGLLADDHPQYLLASGTRPMAGALDMGTNNITNVGTVDGVTVHAHAIRHQPGGVDAISTDVPVNVLVGASISGGSSASLARADHQHGIAAGNAVNVGITNAAGSASSVSRSDHVHALPATGTVGSYSYITFDAYGRETSGTLININTTAGQLTGGGNLSADRTLGLATAGTAGTYNFGNGSITFDAYGRETSASSASNLVLTSRSINTTSGQLTGGGALSSDLTLGLAATGTAGSYSYVTFDAYGRETSGSLISVNTTAGQLTGGGALSANLTLGLATSGVSANTYTISTVTVDVYGRITSASSGTTGTPVATGNANSAGSGTALSLANHIHQTKVDATSLALTTTATTASLTDVVMTDGVTPMTLTPGAGNWLCTFSAQVTSNLKVGTIVFSIYVNGVQVSVTSRTIVVQAVSDPNIINITTLLTSVGAGQAVDVRWHVGAASTATATARELVLVRAV